MRLSLSLLVLVCSVSCSPGCATAIVDHAAGMVAPKPTQPDTNAILRLVGRFGYAHACPVSPTIALTAAHVVDIRPFDQTVSAWPYLWSDGLGNTGAIRSLALGDSRDLAITESSTPFASYYNMASEPPASGTPVWFIGYDLRNRGDAFAPRVFGTSVLRVVAGHVIMKQGGWPSTSGSCVLDGKGEVVAINIAGRYMDNGADVGIAVGTWMLRKVLETQP